MGRLTPDDAPRTLARTADGGVASLGVRIRLGAVWRG